MLKLFWFLVTFLLPLTLWASASGEVFHHGNPSPDRDFILKEVNFIIFVVLLFFLARKPLKEFFATRSAGIRVAIETARQAHLDAKSKHDEITRRLKNLSAETETMVERFKQEGELEARKLVQRAEEFSQKIRDDAGRIAEVELKRAKTELKETAIALSRDLAEKTIQAQLTPADDERLSKSYLQKLRGINQ